MGIDVNRERAIDLAVSQIEKQFGKGAIMKLGEDGARPRHRRRSRPARSGSTWRSASAACRAGASSRSTARSRPARPRSRCRSSPRRRSAAASRPSSTPSTRSTSATRGSSACTIEDLLDLAARQRRAGARDRRHAGALAARSTCWSSTRSRRSCRAPRSRARWATRTWACRRGSCRRRCASSPARSPSRSTIVIFINQIRMKIGVMFGNPETTTGGNALKFYASVRLDIRRIGAIKEGDEVIGSRTKVKVVKNKVAPPVPRGRVRHPLRQRHLAGGRADRPRRRARHHREERRLVRVRRGAHRAGPRERARLPARASRDGRDDRGPGSREVRTQGRRRRHTGTGGQRGECRRYARGRGRPQRGEGRKGLTVDLHEILREGVGRGASDIHLKVGAKPIFRINGALVRCDEAPTLDRDTMLILTQGLLDDYHRRRLKEALQVDAGLRAPGPGSVPRQRLLSARRAPGVAAPDPATRPRDPRAQPAAHRRAHRQGAPRPGPRHRHDRQRQVDHARGDDRPHQPQRVAPHHHDRGPDRVSPRRRPLDHHPARGRHRLRQLRRRPEGRAAPGPRRHPGRRDARPGNHRDRDPGGRDRAPGLVHPAHPRRAARPSPARSPPSPSTSAARSASSSRAS